MLCWGVVLCDVVGVCVVVSGGDFIDSVMELCFFISRWGRAREARGEVSAEVRLWMRGESIEMGMV